MISIPKGTKDVLPQESYKWHFIESKVRKVALDFNIKEIRTPTFEHTELFLRGVGDTTDIVNKEMYTFQDKGDRSMTLKPEGTAGVARAFIENGLFAQTQPTKMYYITPVFRYERPQAGRLREHHQFGIEYYGSESYMADVEVMCVAKTIFDRLGVKELQLNINSIGCPTCRARYNQALKEYLKANYDSLCETCKERYEKNPLRILDCKVETCKEITKNAPVILDYLCDDCKAHHENVMKELDKLKISYVVNPHIVRGLDYYTRTVFEFVSTSIGAQGTVCGGGRYNNLVEQVGGKPCPAVGFGMGLERLILTLESLGLSVGEEEVPDLYIATLSDKAKQDIMVLANSLRQEGISTEIDLMDRSFKGQLKYANKIGAKYMLVLGDDELASGEAKIKNMALGDETPIKLNEIIKFFKEA